MSAVYGVARTAIEAMTPADLLDPEITGGGIRWVYDEYEASALAAASTITVCPDLPVDARIVDWIIDHDALSTVSLSFGTTEDTDEFMAVTACASADKKNFTDDGVAASLGFAILSTATAQTLVITTSGPSAATGTIKVAVAYSAKG